VIADGDPGLGKTTLWCDLGARITTGGPMPDGAQCPTGSVVWLTAEDDLADTLRPRHERAGADLTRVFVLDAIKPADDPMRPPHASGGPRSM